MSIFQKRAKNLKERAFPLGRQDMTAKAEAGLVSARTEKRGKWPELPRLDSGSQFNMSSK